MKYQFKKVYGWIVKIAPVLKLLKLLLDLWDKLKRH